MSNLTDNTFYTPKHSSMKQGNYKYSTFEKKLKFLKKKGNIITFKEPFYPWGTAGESRKQIIVGGLNKLRTGEIKIIGEFYDSDWCKSQDKLIEAIDWKRMEEMHSF